MHSAFALASPWLASKRTLPRFGTTFRRSFLLPSVAPSPKTAPCLPRARTTMSSAGDKKHLTAMDDVKAGAFVRKESAFRSVITNDGSTPFAPVAGRYRLYVSLACPWASRCLMTLSLLGLDEPSVLPVTVVHHFMGDRGWAFVEEGDPDIPPRCEPEPLFGFKNVRDLYFKADPSYSGRFTVPLLWDTELNTIVNNESAEIIVMLNNAFTSLAKTARDLYPENIREEIDAVSESFYAGFNNGVYRKLHMHVSICFPRVPISLPLYNNLNSFFVASLFAPTVSLPSRLTYFHFMFACRVRILYILSSEHRLWLCHLTGRI